MSNWESDVIEALTYLVSDARRSDQRSFGWTPEIEDCLKDSIERCLRLMDVTPTDAIVSEIMDT